MNVRPIDILDYNMQKQKKRVICLSDGKVFDTIKAASRHYGIPDYNICRAIKNGWVTGGLKFEKI